MRTGRVFRRIFLLCAVVFAAFVPRAFAQPAPGAPEALLEKAAAVCDSLRAFRCSLVKRSYRLDGGDWREIRVVSGQIRCDIGSDRSFVRYGAVQTSSPGADATLTERASGSTSTAYALLNGEIRVYSVNDKVVRVGSTEGVSKEHVRRECKFAPPWLRLSVLLENLRNAAPGVYELSMLEPADFNGVQCDIVSVQNTETGVLTRWYITRSDSLPCGFYRELPGIGEGVPASATMWEATDLAHGLTFDDAEFTLRLPEDVHEVEFALPRESSLQRVGEVAPVWSMRDGSGQGHSLSDYAGKVVALVFWNTSDEIGALALARLEEFSAHFAGDDRVCFFAAAAQERNGGRTANLYYDAKGFSFVGLCCSKHDAQAYGYRRGQAPCVVIGPDGVTVYSAPLFAKDEVRDDAIGVVEGLLHAMPESE